VTTVRAPRNPSPLRVTRDDVLASGVYRSDKEWTITGALGYPGAALAPDPAQAPKGTFGFYHLGVAFLVDVPTGSGRRGRIAQRAAGRAFGLAGALVVGLARAAAAAARPPELERQLADPRTLVLPFTDIVEVSHAVVGKTDYLIVTADPGDGGRYPFCFHPFGANLCELLFLFRFFAEMRLVEAELARAGIPPSREGVLGRLAHLAQVPGLSPYFHGAAIPPGLPAMPFFPTVFASAARAAATPRAAGPAAPAVPSGAPCCPRCGGAGRWLAEPARWGCDRCQAYIA
jgi:hypothetical protein